MTWVCPTCNKEFKHKNQWHSCARLSLEDHLQNKSEEVKTTVDKLLKELNKFGEITIDPVKTSIQIRAASTFVSIKIKRDHIELEFHMSEELDEFPVYKIFRMSKNRIVHSVKLDHPGEIDTQLIKWLKKSYDLVKEK